MISEQPAVNLRPMTVGEMLDRAFTVYFKNALVLTAALVVVLVPMLVLNFLAQRDMLGMDMSMIEGAMKNPAAPPPPPDFGQMMAAYTTGLPYLGLTILLATFALPFANSAIIAGISRSYLGQPVRLIDCYRDAFARWPHIVLLAILWVVALVVGTIVAYIGLLIIILVLAIGGGALAPSAPGVVAVIMALIAIPAFLWLIMSGMQVYLAWALSFAAITIERVDPIIAFASGFSRVFRGGAYWRSAGVAAAIAGIFFVFEMIAAGAIGGLFVWLKISFDSAPLALSAFSGLVSAVITPVSFAIVAMYYYDIRIRREGFDLEHLTLLLSRGDPAPQTPTA
jgi:hypothetical protein